MYHAHQHLNSHSLHPVGYPIASPHFASPLPVPISVPYDYANHTAVSHPNVYDQQQSHPPNSEDLFSLFVSDLPSNVTKNEIMRIFTQPARHTPIDAVANRYILPFEVQDVRIMQAQDSHSKYAFVRFFSIEERMRALHTMQGYLCQGRPIRCARAKGRAPESTASDADPPRTKDERQRDNVIIDSVNAQWASGDPMNLKVFVGGVPKNVSADEIVSYFSPFGAITSVTSKADCVFISFERKSCASSAIDYMRLHGLVVRGNKLRVTWSRQTVQGVLQGSKSTPAQQTQGASFVPATPLTVQTGMTQPAMYIASQSQNDHYVPPHQRQLSTSSTSTYESNGTTMSSRAPRTPSPPSLSTNHLSSDQMMGYAHAVRGSSDGMAQSGTTNSGTAKEDRRKSLSSLNLYTLSEMDEIADGFNSLNLGQHQKIATRYLSPASPQYQQQHRLQSPLTLQSHRLIVGEGSHNKQFMTRARRQTVSHSLRNRDRSSSFNEVVDYRQGPVKASASSSSTPATLTPPNTAGRGASTGIPSGNGNNGEGKFGIWGRVGSGFGVGPGSSLITSRPRSSSSKASTGNGSSSKLETSFNNYNEGRRQSVDFTMLPSMTGGNEDEDDENTLS